MVSSNRTKPFFQDVADDMGLIPNKSGDEYRFRKTSFGLFSRSCR